MSSATTDQTAEPTIIIGTLTKLDIRAMRDADSVSFHYHAGESHVSCSKRVKDAGPFDERERRYDIICTSDVTVYRDDNREDRHAAACFAMIHSSQYSEEWQTLVSCLKPGDVLSMRWVAADNNGYLKSAAGEKLYHDRLYVKVKRDTRRLSFHVDDSVCPNNSARMVRER